MILQFTRSGGFSGIKLRTTIDTDEIPADKMELIESALKNTNLTCGTRGVDRFNYTIEVDGKCIGLNEQQHAALIKYLTDKAKHFI